MLSWYNFRSIRSLSHNLLCPLSDLDRSACRPVPIFRCLHQLSVVRPSRFPICVRPAAAWMDIHLQSFLSTPRAIERGKVEILAPVLSPSLSSAAPISPLGISRSVISRRRGGGAKESKSEITQLAFISTRLSEDFRGEREVRGELFQKILLSNFFPLWLSELLKKMRHFSCYTRTSCNSQFSPLICVRK